MRWVTAVALAVALVNAVNGQDYWGYEDDDYEQWPDAPPAVTTSYPQYRMQAQWGAHHTLLTPTYQWSQRGVADSVIVPNYMLPRLNVLPPRSRYMGYSIDVTPFIRQPSW